MKQQRDGLDKHKHSHEIVNLEGLTGTVLQRVEPDGAQNEKDDRQSEEQLWQGNFARRQVIMQILFHNVHV